MNGRALFTFNPTLFKDDDNAGTALDYEEEKEGEERKEESKGAETGDAEKINSKIEGDNDQPDAE